MLHRLPTSTIPYKATLGCICHPQVQRGQSLLKAATDGKREEVARLLAEGADVKAVDEVSQKLV